MRFLQSVQKFICTIRTYKLLLAIEQNCITLASFIQYIYAGNWYYMEKITCRRLVKHATI